MKLPPWSFSALVAVLAAALASCASTQFFGPDGKPVARFQGDMKESDFSMDPAGGIRWKAKSVDHSSATLAQGQAAAGKMTAAGAAVAASGLTLLLK